MKSRNENSVTKLLTRFFQPQQSQQQPQQQSQPRKTRKLQQQQQQQQQQQPALLHSNAIKVVCMPSKAAWRQARQMMTWLLLLAMFVIQGTGCEKILIWSYGIRAPKIETEQSLRAYLSTLGLEDEQFYVFRDTNDMTEFIKKIHSYPDAFFYNKHKQYVSYKAKPSDCNAGVVNFTKDMANIDQKPTDTAYQFSFFQEKMRLLPGLQPVDSTMMSGKDAYVFLLWATYFGKLNETKVLNWVEHIHKAQKSGVNVGYYLINCDYIKDWGITPADLPEFELKD